MKLARYRSAQAWCNEKTKNTEMDGDLAEAFAGILHEYIQAISILLNIINSDSKLSSVTKKAIHSKKLTLGHIKKLIEIE